MYETGTTSSGDAQVLEHLPALLDLVGVAMSAIEQPAARSGSTTCWRVGGQDVGAISAMKCTPQKTMNSALRPGAASWASLNESPVTSANWMTSSRW